MYKITYIRNKYSQSAECWIICDFVRYKTLEKHSW